MGRILSSRFGDDGGGASKGRDFGPSSRERAPGVAGRKAEVQQQQQQHLNVVKAAAKTTRGLLGYVGSVAQRTVESLTHQEVTIGMRRVQIVREMAEGGGCLWVLVIRSVVLVLRFVLLRDSQDAGWSATTVMYYAI